MLFTAIYIITVHFVYIIYLYYEAEKWVGEIGFRLSFAPVSYIQCIT